MTSRIIHILVVDDRSLTRELLVHRLEGEEDLAAEGFASPDDCIERVRACPPDIILMRADMEGHAPFQAARTIAGIAPDTPVLFFSRRIHDVHLEQSFAAAARGFACESDSVANLLDAVRRIAEGHTFFSPLAESRIVGDPGNTKTTETLRTLSSLLSEREKEVLVYVAEGLSSKEIGRRMHLTAKTVESHTSRLMRKLKVRERVSLTRFAIREGFVSP